MIKQIEFDSKDFVYANGTRYFSFQRKGKNYVVEDRCPHRGGPLSLGAVEGPKIICPWHGQRVCLDHLAKIALPSVRVNNHISIYINAVEEQR